MASQTLKRARALAAARKEQNRIAEAARPHFVFTCDNCNITKVEMSVFVPQAMMCAICGRGVLAKWKRPPNYDPEAFKKPQ